MRNERLFEHNARSLFYYYFLKERAGYDTEQRDKRQETLTTQLIPTSTVPQEENTHKYSDSDSDASCNHLLLLISTSKLVLLVRAIINLCANHHASVEGFCGNIVFRCDDN